MEGGGLADAWVESDIFVFIGVYFILLVIVTQHLRQI